MLARPGGEVCLLHVAVDIRGVRGVSDHHRYAIAAVDEHALMTDGVPWRRDHADALGDLSVTIQQLEPRPGKVEPLGGHGFLLARAVQLRALDVERRVLEGPVT